MDSSKKIQISRIKVKNFKLFYNLDIEIDIKSKLFVLIGKNGCGKSTFLKIFEFLKECLNSDVNQALRKMGGYQKVTTRTHENEPIEIELSFRSYENNKKYLL